MAYQLTNEEYDIALRVLRTLNLRFDGTSITPEGCTLMAAYLLVEGEASKALVKSEAESYNCYSTAATA